MRGSIVKRYKNSYTIILELGNDPVTGKRKQQWVSVKGTKKEAEKKLSELLHQLDIGTFIKPNKITLAEFMERWLKDYAWPGLAPRTAEGYEHIIRRHLIPGLGKTVLTQLKPEQLQRYYSEKLASGRCDGKGGLSPKTVRHHHVTLHAALQSAVKWGLLSRNPADAVDAPRFQRPEMHTLSEDEMYVFLEAVKSTLYYELFYTALYIGMRRSELLALRWLDVDLLLCQVSVTRSLHHLRDGSFVFRQPKTAKGRRMVVLPPSASLLLKQGIHPKVVQERLGHASIQITLDTYSHVAPGLQEAAAALFDKGLAPRVNISQLANH